MKPFPPRSFDLLMSGVKGNSWQTPTLCDDSTLLSAEKMRGLTKMNETMSCISQQ